jgi:hypothetical protein
MPVVIDRGLAVKTDRRVFQIWDRFLPVTLAPGQNLVLAETAYGNFNSSDSGLSKFPIVTATLKRGGCFLFLETTMAYCSAMATRRIRRKPARMTQLAESRHRRKRARICR